LSLTAFPLLIKSVVGYTHYANDTVPIVVQSVQPCHLYGDSDIYGIGIRLSLYIQWATMIVAIPIAGEGDFVPVTRMGFNIVALAVLINTYISASSGSFAILELYIVSCLVVFLSGYFIIPWGSNERRDAQREEDPPIIRNWTLKRFWDTIIDWRPVDLFDLEPVKADPIGIGVLLLIDTGFLLSQPWLYFVILNQGHSPGCVAEIYVAFVYVDLYSHSWVSFLKASAILSVFLAIVLGFFGCYAIIWGIPHSWNKTLTPDPADETHIRGGNLPHNHGGRRRTFIKRLEDFSMAVVKNIKRNIIRLFFAVTGAFFIVFVEKTLQTDNIDLSNAPLNATSQLIPFLVGVFSAVPVLWESLKQTSDDLRHLPEEEWVQDLRQDFSQLGGFLTSGSSYFTNLRHA
jgi:hypothetical protein